MRSAPSRRDFLKLAALLPVSMSVPAFQRRPGAGQVGALGAPNVVVVVLDALSAYNLSLHGYARETTPNLSRLATRAIVYHNHFAASNFTTPGTASLLTGTLPWTHRAIQHNNQVARPVAQQNLFAAFGNYHRSAYTHNTWAYTLLRQFHDQIETLIPPEDLYLAGWDKLIGTLFADDEDLASVGWARNFKIGGGYAYSLFLSHLYRTIREHTVKDLTPLFPRGLPASSSGSDSSYLLEQATDWTGALMAGLPQPFLTYLHFLPPHEPYNAPLEFCNWFSGDRYQPPVKPVDVFNESAYPDMLRLRRWYDEFILYADREFGRLYDAMRTAGLLDNTWIIVTSDHGEMFERGFHGHDNPTLYQPLVRVPLLVFEPGRQSRTDIQALTSAVDILPTLAHLTGHAIPDWAEGVVLPPFAANPNLPRAIYAVQARDNAPDAPLTQASTMLIRDNYKLLYYFGYRERGIEELVQLYDFQADPEELMEISSYKSEVTAELLDELQGKIRQVNQPYL